MKKRAKFIACEVEKILSKENVTVRVIDVNKNNSIFTGIQLSTPGKNVSPVVYMENFEDKEDEDIINFIVETYNSNNHDFGKNISEEVGQYSKWDVAKHHVFLGVYSNKNVKLLNNKPTNRLEDMLVYLFIQGDGYSFDVTNDILNQWKVSKEEAFSYAEVNTEKRTKIQNIMGVLYDLNSDMEEEMERKMEPDTWSDIMYVVGNADIIKGAGIIACPNYMQKVKHFLGTDRYYIIPSSIHELLVVADNGEIEAERLLQMVNEINDDDRIIDQTDILTSSIYKCDYKGVKKINFE